MKPAPRPERVLLVLALEGGECRGVATRFSDEARFRFESVAELSVWLLDPGRAAATPERGARDDAEPEASAHEDEPGTPGPHGGSRR